MVKAYSLFPVVHGYFIGFIRMFVVNGILFYDKGNVSTIDFYCSTSSSSVLLLALFPNSH